MVIEIFTFVLLKKYLRSALESYLYRWIVFTVDAVWAILNIFRHPMSEETNQYLYVGVSFRIDVGTKMQSSMPRFYDQAVNMA
jgi:hypothetical protein